MKRDIDVSNLADELKGLWNCEDLEDLKNEAKEAIIFSVLVYDFE